MKAYSWEKNGFYQDIRHRVERLWENVHTDGLEFDCQRKMWRQKSVPGKCSVVAFLQNQYLCWDITDRGIGVLPMVDDLRTWFDLSAVIQVDGETVDLREDTVEQEIYYGPGVVERVCVLPQGSVALRFSLPDGADFARITIAAQDFITPVSISPYILLPLEEWKIDEGKILAKVTSYPIFDEVAARNNSVTADPLRPLRGKIGGLEIDFFNAVEKSRLALSAFSKKFILICDRKFPERGFAKLFLGETGLSGPAVITIRETAALSPNPAEGRSWSEVLKEVSFSCQEDPRLERQFYFSMHNSLFSRTFAQSGETMFIHGRPDHGYGDCSKPHQSYQMYFPALLAGKYDWVKSELRAFSILMEEDGGLAFQLKTGGGRHHYDGPYSNAHYLMGLHRYLCFSGDFSFLQETVVCERTGKSKSILDCALKAGEWLLQGKTEKGVMKPCGWLDAWPPSVTAQAQISFTVYHAFMKLADILQYIGHSKADFYFREAEQLKEKIKLIFYNPTTGLYGEHLFADGSVRGGDLEDFWVHTQVWANICGIENRQEPLEICERYCRANGVRVIPDSGMESDYIEASTDGLSDLSAGSTATWLLAAWPELTNLFALSWARAGNSQKAYETVCSQLPETLYRKFKTAAPFYYAEKYLYPYGLPWLCTWAGDPTLIEYFICGLLGVQFTLKGYTVSPKIPESFHHKNVNARFLWRGQRVEISTDRQGNLCSNRDNSDKEPIKV